jgi:hypothetical protein
VYVETARQFLHGADIYRHVAVAPPPLIVFSGTGILAVSDSNHRLVLAEHVGVEQFPEGFEDTTARIGCCRMARSTVGFNGHW